MREKSRRERSLEHNIRKNLGRRDFVPKCSKRHQFLIRDNCFQFSNLKFDEDLCNRAINR